MLCVAGHMSSARIFPGCAKPYLTAGIEEWIVTAYTYALYGKPHDAGAMMDVGRLCGVEQSKGILLDADRALWHSDDAGRRGRNAKIPMPWCPQ